MATLKELQTKIASLKNTQKITKAMKMIAATKLRRAQQAVENSKPYAESLATVMQAAVNGATASHPLCEVHTEEKVATVVVFTSDRGLCGGYNTQMIKKAVAALNDLEGEGSTYRINAVGKRGNAHFSRFPGGVETFYDEAMANSDFAHADEIATNLIDAYLRGEVSEVKLVYNHFQSALTQVPTVQTLLPVVMNDSSEEGEQTAGAAGDVIFEPSAKEILSDVVIRTVKFQVYRALLNAVASEHASRMTAMENASNNSGDMIDKYTLQRNRARQAAITTELTEIVSGAEAL